MLRGYSSIAQLHACAERPRGNRILTLLSRINIRHFIALTQRGVGKCNLPHRLFFPPVVGSGRPRRAEKEAVWRDCVPPNLLLAPFTRNCVARGQTAHPAEMRSRPRAAMAALSADLRAPRAPPTRA